MDPITVIGFAAAVVQLIDVTPKVVDYFNDVIDTPKDRGRFSQGGYKPSCTLCRLKISCGRNYFDGSMVY